jgi:uncharacterized phage-associated protein
MSYMKLNKLLYLTDRKSLLKRGRPITTDCYAALPRGPVVSRILDLTMDGECRGAESIWTAVISKPANYEVRLTGDAECDELSNAEIAILDEIFSEYGAMSRWDLGELTHQLPEWEDPDGGAIPISYRNILKAGGKTDSEITAIVDEIADIEQFDVLLNARN